VRLRTRASAALLGVSCAVGGVAALAVPAAHAQVRSATSATASAPNSSDWHYAGKYYVQAKCHEDGKKHVLEGADDYVCEEEVEPDGTTAYWNLWVLFLPLQSA
jgi:hypothetical protein